MKPHIGLSLIIAIAAAGASAVFFQLGLRERTGADRELTVANAHHAQFFGIYAGIFAATVFAIIFRHWGAFHKWLRSRSHDVLTTILIVLFLGAHIAGVYLSDNETDPDKTVDQKTLRRAFGFGVMSGVAVTSAAFLSAQLDLFVGLG